MSEPFDNDIEYFNWLCAKVTDVDFLAYRGLLKILYETEFVPVVAGDQNRAEDGIELRDDFVTETRIELDPHWRELPCSILEFLIAFAKRAAFQTGTPSRDWFWDFMSNLGLDGFQRISTRDVTAIEDILQSFITRTENGHGFVSMFPLRIPPDEQNGLEIWYQFCEWATEQGLY